MNYNEAYNVIMALQDELDEDVRNAHAVQFMMKDASRCNYQEVKALAATYELQEYLANKIALIEEIKELDEAL